MLFFVCVFQLVFSIFRGNIFLFPNRTPHPPYTPPHQVANPSVFLAALLACVRHCWTLQVA